MKIDSSKFGTATFAPYNVYNKMPQKDNFDYVVCTNKALEPEKLPEAIAPAVGDKTTIVLIQNGVLGEEPVRKRFPKNPILACVTWTNAQQPTPGTVVHILGDNIDVGIFDPNSATASAEAQQEALARFVAILGAGDAQYEIWKDIVGRRWEKVTWNAAWNSITALTGADTRSFLDSSDRAEPITRRLMNEVIAIAAAAGHPLPPTLVDDLFKRILSMPGIGSSMLTDVRNDRPIEVESIIGGPMRLAHKLGVPSPTLDLLYVLLKAVDQKIRAGGSKSL